MITSPIFTTSKSADEITVSDVCGYIKKHKNKVVPRLAELDRYYNGEHSILTRKKSSNLANERVVVNYAAYISNFMAGYMLGQPVTYSSKSGNDISDLRDALDLADSATQDSDLALDASIYGCAYDMVYMSSTEPPYPKLARLSPLNAFVVYDDTVEQSPVFGAYYYPIYDENDKIEKYICSLQTDKYVEKFVIGKDYKVISKEEPTTHYFGAVPINEIYNNGRRSGDFEQVISLIEANNTLLSDRINDKVQFVNAILLITGGTFGDNEDESNETIDNIRSSGILEMPEGSGASYLTRQFDEGSLEVLSKTIVDNIHKISSVPNLSDEKFASNASGVAMQYKMLGEEQVVKTKIRFFTEGLRYRLMLFANVLNITYCNIDIADIDIKFTCSTPSNELEIAQTANLLQNLVPRRTLLAHVPWVTNVDEAEKQLKEEAAEKAQSTADLFGNMPLE